MATPDPAATADEIVIRLSSSYSRQRLDRLIRQLQPILELEEPRVIRLDLNGLVFLGPTAQAVVAAAFHRAISEGFALGGSVVVMPRSKHLLGYLSRMDFFSRIIGPLPEGRSASRRCDLPQPLPPLRGES